MVENNKDAASGDDALLSKCESAFPDTLSLWDRAWSEVPGASRARHSVHNVELYKNTNKAEQLELARELEISAPNEFFSRLKAGRVCAEKLNEREELIKIKDDARSTADKLESELAHKPGERIKVLHVGAGIVNIARSDIDNLLDPIFNIHSKALYRPEQPERIMKPELNKEQEIIFNEINSRPGLKAEISSFPSHAPQHIAVPDYFLTARKKD